MAKYGEGDKRWIVEERPDGTNVHNWHWAEKDCLEWSRKRLGELLEDIPILTGEGGLWIKTMKLDSVTGEAYVNIRKGKIIPGYELKVKVSWEGEAKDGSGNSLGKVESKVELPYLSDENADEDPELRVTSTDDSLLAKRLKEAFLAKGKPIVLAKVKEYVNHMTAGGPAKDELQQKGTKLQADCRTNSTKSSFQEKVAPAPPPKIRGGLKTIALTEKFHCRPSDLYSMFLDGKTWKIFTQSRAEISPEVGGRFTIFDGAVEGVFLKLEDNRMIVQKWRFANWKDGQYSNVCLSFEEPEAGVTVVKLTQTDVPEEDRYGNETVIENTTKGWKELIFHKIRAVFGYGL
eukprot:TRINITY_DN3253_c0_g1_i2.p1 TRINITY_DN3253_c0_g1~~TRINITY_DN3253_c0_g1_i2.p1  ORF type:complete len:347 (+),score=65.43 TRINITY_DN3253_c0_g1_i2:111-1151(+)